MEYIAVGQDLQVILYVIYKKTCVFLEININSALPLIKNFPVLIPLNNYSDFL